ncbi:MAG: RNA polymerase factor sigma-54 [Candidatus Tectimicrobiota bacterium]
MALETKLLLKTTQKLVMTAMLQQAIKLLPLSRLELIQKIHQEILENPFLEELATQETNSYEIQSSTASQESKEQSDDTNDDSNVDWESYTHTLGTTSDYSAVDSGREVPSLEATLKSETSLAEYLLWQLSLTVDDELDRQIGTYLIGNIDDDGYLQCQPSEVSDAFAVEEARVCAVLAIIQSFDPPGVGARDLQESLLAQLRQLEMEDSLASHIVQNHLQQLDERSLQKIAKTFGVTIQEVLEAVHVIRTLDPKPGSRYNAPRVEYIIPDVIVVKIENDYQVFLNEEGIPRLRVNALYHNILRQNDGVKGETKEYLEEKFRSAVWLMKSVEQRRQTLLKVTKSLCRFQWEFLDKGLAHLKPLVLKDVAEDIGMHESTVSRVTTNKYVHTPQGIFELKFFFHSGLESVDGDAMSSVSVKDIIRRAVAAEDARKPLTDQQLMAILEQKGVRIARRTIAKYRQELRIPPANRRKRIFSS